MLYQAFKELNEQMSDDIVNFANGEGLSEQLYDALFSYYCSSNEMPYGVAKARTGDPYEWIDSTFTDFIEKLLTLGDMATVESDGFHITSIKT
jgi:cobalamin-dependent methionine synthase I